MDSEDDSGLHTTALVVFLLILSTLGIVWTLSCSWLTGRKKRQRVGHNADVGDGLVLEINRPAGRIVNRPVSVPLKSPRCKSTDRYSVQEQSLGVVSEDLGRSLRLPTIIVTPPTPVDMFEEVTSLGSGGSIGTADDLITGSDDLDAPAGADDAQGVTDELSSKAFTRGATVRDSMRNRVIGLYSDLSLDSLEGAIVCDVTVSSEVSGHPMSTQDASSVHQSTSTPVVKLTSTLPPSLTAGYEEAQMIIRHKDSITQRPLPEPSETSSKIPTHHLPRRS